MSDTHELPIFWIKRKDDENVELFVGTRSVASLNHDEHGRAGMKLAEEMFRKIAYAVDAKVREL